MNMKLTKEQQAKVEENLGLVYKVLGDKLKGQSSVGSYTREDLFQVGCIGLCKAAATDKGGTFSTYAYRLIWHEICDVLVKANKQKNTEVIEDCEQNIPEPDDGERNAEINFDLVRELMSAKAKAPHHIVKGIDAMVLMAKGYTCREIGVKMGASDNLVSAYVSKARKFLKNRPGAARMMEIYAA
ncbi:MAG: sigma-70 family RNA polymerase sigma factor [Acutalibacter sp.]|jgi:RNA polymerase sigma factor (sigma-70 family)|uniref:sigma-70 family RNA polymerase sigma factor n=1 Tax=Acutalibacter sp. TaxID=1918636 RepID=UPI002171625E|nr:sigma-70 family RNA polymerase sigma factor [Acutalibacter sp.]MCI9225655.1 sigma-70 family RNA polymerase sigma factor [Acutalibacter sp.]